MGNNNGKEHQSASSAAPSSSSKRRGIYIYTAIPTAAGYFGRASQPTLFPSGLCIALFISQFSCCCCCCSPAELSRRAGRRPKTRRCPPAVGLHQQAGRCGRPSMGRTLHGRRNARQRYTALPAAGILLTITNRRFGGD